MRGVGTWRAAQEVVRKLEEKGGVTKEERISKTGCGAAGTNAVEVKPNSNRKVDIRFDNQETKG